MARIANAAGFISRFPEVTAIVGGRPYGVRVRTVRVGGRPYWGLVIHWRDPIPTPYPAWAGQFVAIDFH